ncbi:prephenate dehydrogenase [Arsenicicoccus sp. oral taxon 190]|uniref:prephenate dehydrogenase n=1 Tax=Arsenicicoccus sp. oral taxon 190 TaxID=1658671 RepID=UPI00067A1868|nr:prephenate dehydrogenase [Arsenicicoccus sp. oral taxon 190]AKT51824.1 prephenate dehydrogenase [Arsenicicoccus sp. oral taxon 190]
MSAGPSRRARIVGTGLIGTSVGLALRAAGWQVSLQDPSPTAALLARDLGAGELDDLPPDVVVVAAPPDVAAQVVTKQLERWPDAVVTDVASVKGVVADGVRARGGDLSRYVGSHPMAGRERSGAVAARPDLFEGRAWVVVPTPASSDEAVERVVALARAARGEVVQLSAADHDAAVATVSHLPQVMATLTAARLRDQAEDAVGLAGQGLRDVTRIAASDPLLWTQILAGNAAGVRDVLRGVQDDLAVTVQALDQLARGEDARGARAVLAGLLDDGNRGRALVPGKHGGAPTTYEVVTVVVPDEPGALGRLFAAMGEADINLEDLHLEHAVGHPVALAEVSVLPAVADRLRDHLGSAGWRIH